MESVWKLPRSIKSLNIAFGYINRNKKLLLGIAGVASVAALLYFRSKRDETDVFEKKLVSLNALEEQVVEQMSRVPYTDFTQAAAILKDSTLPGWYSFQQQLAQTEDLNLQEHMQSKRQLLSEYASLRVEQTRLLHSAFSENTNAYDGKLQQVYERINAVLDELAH